jgi:hypothetical protein
MTAKKKGRPSLRQQGDGGETRRSNLDMIIIARNFAVRISPLSLACAFQRRVARLAVVGGGGAGGGGAVTAADPILAAAP